MPLTKAEISRLRGLRDKKAREEAGRFVVEGEKVVAELLAAEFPFEVLYAVEGWMPPKRGSQVEVVTAELMARISHFPTPSRVLAVGRLRREELRPGELEQGRTLALDGVQDAGNVGTLLRVADWFGFDRVLLSPDCADIFSQKVINASMGSFSRMRVIVGALAPMLAAVRARVPVLGCDLEGEPLDQVAPLERGVVVIGSEGRGLSSSVAAMLNRRVTIPRFGQAESLNAGVAGGIVCAHLRRGVTDSSSID